MPGASWFPGAQVNFAQQVFGHADGAHAAGHPAIVFRDEVMQRRGRVEEIGWPELRRQVGALAARAAGDGREPGDRVVAFLPNMPEAAVAFLACASLGAIWSICSPDMGPLAVLDRFRQIAPKVLIACDGYGYGGAAHDRDAGARRAARRVAERQRRDRLAPPGARATLRRSRRRAPRCTTSTRLDRAPAAPSRRAGCRSIIRSGSSIRAAPPACRRRSCTATAASCSSS